MSFAAWLRGVQADPGGAFDPSQIADLRLWLRGDLGVTLDGSSNVQTWADQSGGAHNATQATVARRPVVSTLAGQTSIAFTAGTDQLVVADHADLDITAGMYWWIVASSSEASTARGILGKWGPTGANGEGNEFCVLATGVSSASSCEFIARNAADTANQIASDGQFNNNTAHIVQARYSGGQGGIRVDGGAEATVAVASINPNIRKLMIGGYVEDSLTYVPGINIAEIIIAVPTAGEITSVRAYLSDRYGITV